MAAAIEVIPRIREEYRQLTEATSKGLLTQFPDLLAPARSICDVLGRLDIGHLHGVPIRLLNDLSNTLSEIVALVNDVISKSFPADQSVDRGVVRPQALVQNQTNVNSWRGQLEKQHAALFQLAGPIVAQQEDRRAWIGAPAIRLELASSLKEAKPEVLWRYMPLRNVLRCESASGIWMSSLERLRMWSRPGIPDIREGEIHPTLRKITDGIKAAVTTKDLMTILNEFGISLQDGQELLKTEGRRFNLETTFVSSWARAKHESNQMWTAYGDGGHGIAIRSNLSKLEACRWRAPLDLCGYIGGNRMEGLALRKVEYPDFDEAHRLPGNVEDWYPPLLKRPHFEDEHEARLLAFTETPVASMGFTLHCNLTNLISEIVVGPHADFAEIESQIHAFAPDLDRIPITHSKLAPK